MQNTYVYLDQPYKLLSISRANIENCDLFIRQTGYKIKA
jgi:hypothetical protein